jgi:catechol 2,3-dioxygenase-like lactoylglutathione lyase family enzyme
VFTKIMPVLRVAELQRAIDWYTTTLGFELCWRAPNDGGGENCMLGANETSLMLTTGSHLGDKPAFTGTLYFEMTGVLELYGRVKEKVEIVWPLEPMEYGTLEFGVHDLDGYTLAFAEQSQG